MGVIVAKLVFYFTMDDQLFAYVEDNFTKECVIDEWCSNKFVDKMGRLWINEYDVFNNEGHDSLWMCSYWENKCYLFSENAYSNEEVVKNIEALWLKKINDSFVEIKYDDYKNLWI